MRSFLVGIGYLKKAKTGIIGGAGNVDKEDIKLIELI